MSFSKGQIIEVFPVNNGAFFPTNWFETYASKLIQPSFLLMVLILILSIGFLALKKFEHANLEGKLWNIPVLIILVTFWPQIVLSIKHLVDVFNTFLIHDVFQMEWVKFGYPEKELEWKVIFMRPAEVLFVVLPNLSYWLIYSLYMIYFFFFSVLGPFVLAKGILADEIETFLEIVKELSLLFMWQTTLVILVAIVSPKLVNGDVLSRQGDNSFFMSLIIAVLICLVPTVTTKFASHLGGSIFPPAMRALGAIFGIAITSRSLAAIGIPVHSHRWESLTHNTLMIREFAKATHHRHEVMALTEDRHLLEKRMEEMGHALPGHGSGHPPEPTHGSGHHGESGHGSHGGGGHDHHGHGQAHAHGDDGHHEHHHGHSDHKASHNHKSGHSSQLVHLAKKAKHELKGGAKHDDGKGSH